MSDVWPFSGHSATPGAARGTFGALIVRSGKTCPFNPFSPNRAHADRAIPPVTLGIEPKPSDLANCWAESVLFRCPVFGAKNQMIGASSQDVASTFDYRRMRCAHDPKGISKRLRQQRPCDPRPSMLAGVTATTPNGRQAAAEVSNHKNTESCAQGHNNI